jgi:hypothetical protein
VAEQMNKEVAEIWQLIRETQAQFRETDARLDARFRETDAKLRRLEGLFGSQWGKLIEALVQPSVIRLFQGRGIDVHYVSQRVKSQLNGRSKEIDLLLENSEVVVVVEIKTTLRISDVNDFLADLAEFHHFYPKFARDRLFGAVAGLDIVEEADRYAYRRGLFVLQVSGEETVQMLNDEKFTPHNFTV